MLRFLEYENDKNTLHHTFWIFFFKLSIKNHYEILKTENTYLRNAINQIGADKLPPATGELRQWQRRKARRIKNCVIALN